MSEIKIIFFDIDGTLVDPQTGCISEKTAFTLNRLRENGIKLCVATGRPTVNLPDFGDLHFDVLCTFNGALCCTKEETIYSAPISLADVERILENAAAIGRPVSVAVKDAMAANGVDEDLADYYTLAGLKLTASEDFDAVCREDVYQIMLGCRESDYAAIMRGTAGVKIAISWDRAVDVISASSGKGAAVDKILAYYNLDVSQSLAFGDSHNDVEMLQAAGTGVAMGNAAEQLKEIADDICGSVSEDGIYHYCIDHGLI